MIEIWEVGEMQLLIGVPQEVILHQLQKCIGTSLDPYHANIQLS